MLRSALVSMTVFQTCLTMIRFPIPAVLLLSILLGACAASEPVTVENDDLLDAPVNPLDGYSYLQNEAGSLIMNHSATGTTRLGDSGDMVFSSQSGDGEFVALATASATSSVLSLIGRDSGSVLQLHEGGADLAFTGVWTSDASRFYFGFYQPVGKQMGEGDIRYVDVATGEIGRVGCSASKAVLAVMADGSLLVRNSDNLYQVTADGCDTLRSVDARKMYHITVSPDGGHIAYVLRDLVYNRDSRQYEPDSTLYLELSTGSDPVKIVGDKYAPRNMSWSPDGSEIVFDVGVQDDTSRRAISVYTLDSGQSSYLVAPTSTTTSHSHASFSPNGQHVVFKSAENDGQPDWMVKTNGVQFSQVLPIDASVEDRQWSWVTGDTALIAPAGSESELIVINAGSVASVAVGTGVLQVWTSN